MDTNLTGSINPGDTPEIREWIEKQVGQYPVKDMWNVSI
jgi:hypothetical protein